LVAGKNAGKWQCFWVSFNAHSSTKPGIIRAMAWVSYSHENGVGWVQSTCFFFYAHENPIALKYQERLELMNAFFSTSRSASPPLLQIMLETTRKWWVRESTMLKWNPIGWWFRCMYVFPTTLPMPGAQLSDKIWKQRSQGFRINFLLLVPQWNWRFFEHDWSKRI
jgi:hypothetical protein